MTEQQTHRAAVTVAYVNPPRDKGKSGTIKDVDGQFWSVWPTMLNQFEPGETYEVDYEQKGVYRNVKSARPVAPAAPPLPVAARQPQYEGRVIGTSDCTKPAPVQIAKPASVVVVPKETPHQPQQQWYRPTHPRDARRMFLTATLGHFIETGRVECNGQAIANAIDEILAAYDARLAREDQVSAG
jgi:hypothetical protein